MRFIFWIVVAAFAAFLYQWGTGVPSGAAGVTRWSLMKKGITLDEINAMERKP